MINFLFLIYSLFFFLFLNSFIARKLNLYDVPSKTKIHKEKTPLTGGFYFVFIILLNILAFETNQLTIFKILYFVFPFIFLFIVGFCDDKFKLSAITRLLLIFLLLILFFSLDNNLIINEIKIFFKDFYFYKKTNTLILTSLCVIVLIIMFNLIDGIDGMAISFFINWFIISFLFYNYDFAKHYIFFLASLIFLYFNLRKKIFLGSGGNMLLSFYIAKETITTYNTNNDVDLISISLFFFLPFIDATRLFFSRIINEKSPFQRDLNHLHHHLFKKFKNGSIIIYNLLIFISVTLYNIYNINILFCYGGLFFLYLIFLMKTRAL
jgi:UDP-GlcNAc:undecaprenyl-phosphate GlcNAc-1-phosphate transferase